MQVFFGSAQAQVLNVQFHTIDVITPAARDTNPNGSGAVTGPVDVRVLNVNSGKSVIAPAAFRYINKMQITAITPTFGSAFTGGTRRSDRRHRLQLTPVTVISSPASRALGHQGHADAKSLDSHSSPTVNAVRRDAGPVIVTNVDNGDSATAPTWIYR